MAGYIGSKAVITSGVSASIDELNIIDGLTATTAELNILDGVTSTAAELNILDGVTSTAAELNILDGVTSTAAELNIMDGVTATAAEINLIDGDTSRGTTTIVDADGVLVNDAGTMRMTTVATLATYMGTKIGGGLVFLASTGAISDGTASVIFNQIDATKYDSYEFHMLAVVPVTDSVQLLMQLSADGTNFDTTDGNYHETATDRVGMIMSAAGVGSGDTGEAIGLNGRAQLYNVSSSTANTALYNDGGYHRDSGNFTAMIGVGNYQASTAAHTAVKILFTSGNIESGEITMFGIVNS